MKNEENTITQPKNEQSQARREWSSNQQGALLHDRQNSSSGCIRYFSMFTGVGGFELGLERTYNDSINTGAFSNNERLQSSSSKCDGYGGRTYSNDNQEASSQSDKESRTDSSNIDGKPSAYWRNKLSFSCVGFSEIDKYANQLLAKRFPDIPNFGDCTKINPSELPDFDMLCGGFPCQSFSIAGKRRGFNDTRGTMFFEVARILEVKRPRIVFLENVKGLLNHDKGETFKVILQTLEELGYEVQWMVLNSKFFGVPQNRERVFIIGSLRGTSRPEILPFRTNLQQTSEQHSSQVSNAITSRYYKQGNADTYVKRMDTQIGRDKEIYRFYSDEGISPALHLKTGGWQEPKIAIPVLTPDREDKRQNGRSFNEHGDESFTLTKTDIHGISDGLKIRRLTPTECERLQGFPDNWTAGFSDTQRYKMMGNAVTVNVIKAIGEKLT